MPFLTEHQSNNINFMSQLLSRSDRGRTLIIGSGPTYLPTSENESIKMGNAGGQNGKGQDRL